MNNAEYHNAARRVPNWNRLSIQMKARYGGWIIKSTSCWTPRFQVVVTRCNNRKVDPPYVYPFENKQDAEECKAWWKENNSWVVVEEL